MPVPGCSRPSRSVAEWGAALIVSVTRLQPDPSLTVGSAVSAGRNRIGEVLDLSRVERQALARYTRDAGNHVTVQVFPAAALSLP